jgi:hypothetical protein
MSKLIKCLNLFFETVVHTLVSGLLFCKCSLLKNKTPGELFLKDSTNTNLYKIQCFIKPTKIKGTINRTRKSRKKHHFQPIFFKLFSVYGRGHTRPGPLQLHIFFLIPYHLNIYKKTLVYSYVKEKYIATHKMSYKTHLFFT